MTRQTWTMASIVALSALFAPPAAQAQHADVALVYRLMLDGQMVVLPAAGPERRAEVGDRLRHRDVIATSANTRAAIRFTDDGSILRLSPHSQLQLRAEGERNALVRTLELEFGEVWARVNRREGAEFRIQTPAGVAAVKGTEFVVRVDEAGVTTVLTLEGVVEFFNDAGSVDVTARSRVQVSSASQAPAARPATDDELRGVQELRGEEGGGDGEGVWIEVRMEDAAGRTRTLMMEVPRGALRGHTVGGI
jgi:hypothetical protein